MHESTPERVTYPTGLVVMRHRLTNEAGTLRITVEHDLVVPPGHPLNGGRRWSVTGCMVPAHVDLALPVESLPFREFRTERFARAYALQLYRKWEPEASRHRLDVTA